MSLLAGYDNQTAGWKRFQGVDSYAKKKYADGVTIRCRIQADRRLVRDSLGDQVVSETAVYCTDKVGPQDILTISGRDYPVIRAAELADIDGRYDHMEVRL